MTCTARARVNGAWSSDLGEREHEKTHETVTNTFDSLKKKSGRKECF